MNEQQAREQRLALRAKIRALKQQLKTPRKDTPPAEPEHEPAKKTHGKVEQNEITQRSTNEPVPIETLQPKRNAAGQIIEWRLVIEPPEETVLINAEIATATAEAQRRR